jgi:threonine 3-dehydrogenase
MTETIDALVMKRGEPGALVLERIPLPVCGDNDVLVKINKTAICGTDVHIYDWNDWARRTIPTPMTIGHEFVGRVAVAGKNAKGFEPGMLVSGEGHVVCGKCRNCLAGRRHLCKDTSGVGVNRPGIFAQYAAIPATNIWICDESIPEDVLACFDPLGNAVHSCLEFDAVGEDVLITGAGPIGIMSVAIMKHVGARNVVVTDINPYRLRLAELMGATRTVDVRTQRIEDAMRALNMKEGFDIGMEMSGSAVAFRQMVNVMYHGGKIALLGLQEGETPLDWNTVIFSSLTIKGVYGREMYETWYKMSSMLQSGLNIGPVITHRFPYWEFAQGFAAMKSGQSGKVILNWEEERT